MSIMDNQNHTALDYANALGLVQLIICAGLEKEFCNQKIILRDRDIERRQLAVVARIDIDIAPCEHRLNNLSLLIVACLMKRGIPVGIRISRALQQDQIAKGGLFCYGHKRIKENTCGFYFKQSEQIYSMVEHRIK